MKLILSELQRDLRHRLAVYAKTARVAKSAEKQHALLQNSQLWRLLQASSDLLGLNHRQWAPDFCVKTVLWDV